MDDQTIRSTAQKAVKTRPFKTLDELLGFFINADKCNIFPRTLARGEFINRQISNHYFLLMQQQC